MIKSKHLAKGIKSEPIVLLITVLLWAGLIQAQESTNTSGGDATGSGGTVAYSIGQVVYSTNMGSTGSAVQGVQQSYLISNVGMNETALNISLTAYPNPTAENLTLQISDYNNEKLTYQLFDIQGKQLSKGQIVAEQTHINMSSLPRATYFIKIINQESLTADRQGEIVQSFKIIKN